MAVAKKEYTTILGINGVRGSLFKLAMKGEIVVNDNRATRFAGVKCHVRTEESETQQEEQKIVIANASSVKVDYQAKRENSIHKKKLLEICEGYGEDEVRIACAVFARNYPDVMYDALRNEHENMRKLVNGVHDLSNSFLRKFDGEK